MRSKQIGNTTSMAIAPHARQCRDLRVVIAMLLATLMACSFVAGCGTKETIAPLSGVVRFEGKPLEFGSVMLQPVEGGETSTARIESDGSFVMQIRGGGEGATVGVNRVRVTCYPAQRPGASSSSSQELALGRSLIPTRYSSFGSSDLSVEVHPDKNEPYVIELSRK